MGNCCTVEGAVDHWIFVKTGDLKGGEAEVRLKITLVDVQGHQSDVKTVNCYFGGNFEKGSSITKECFLPINFGRVKCLKVERDDSDPSRNWFCEAIIINDRRKGDCVYFPVLRWLSSGRVYEFYENDTFTSQNDPCLQISGGYLQGLRAKELQERQAQYQFGQLNTGTPLQARILPPDEIFEDQGKMSIDVKRTELFQSAALPRSHRGNWQTLDELTHVYASAAFPEPACMDRWTDDLYFAAQRLVGCNPCMIQLCTELPENMAVTAEMLKPFLEGWTLKQIIDAKRLFIVDYEILAELPTKDDNEVCAPIALFLVTGEKLLAPIAIQLYQQVSQNNPVYLPTDEPYIWLQAKMWLNHADACVHMAIHNITYTHMIMESIAVSMNRNLTPTHPVYKLLQPHLQHLMLVNQRSTNELLKPGGWIDSAMSIGREGVLELIRRGFEKWSLSTHGNFPRELVERGVADPKILPNYSYREDGLLLHKAIENYVHKVLYYYYPSGEIVEKDFLLQNWTLEMARSILDGGAGLQGIPYDGKLKCLADLQQICVCVIFTCTAQYSAITQGIYDQYAFPPNYPVFLQNEPPEDKRPIQESNIIALLPPKDVTMDTIIGAKLLSTHREKPFGEHVFQYNYDPAIKAIEEQFRTELESINKMITQRNNYRGMFYKYDALLPSRIPDYIPS